MPVGAKNATTEAEYFADAWVGFVPRTSGNGRYISMRLRSGYQTFSCDLEESQRGLMKAEKIADSLGLALLITDEAREAMESRPA